MEIEKYSPKWLLEKINNSKNDAHKLMHIIEYSKEIIKSTDQQLILSGVSHRREQLIDFCTKLELKAKQYSYLIPDEDFIDEYLKDN